MLLDLIGRCCVELGVRVDTFVTAAQVCVWVCSWLFDLVCFVLATNINNASYRLLW